MLKGIITYILMKRRMLMKCSVVRLCDKDVISVCNGCKIGVVSDVEFDSCTGNITSIVICGKQGFFGMGKTEDICIPWCDIQVIGEDSILVKTS